MWISQACAKFVTPSPALSTLHHLPTSPPAPLGHVHGPCPPMIEGAFSNYRVFRAPLGDVRSPCPPMIEGVFSNCSVFRAPLSQFAALILLQQLKVRFLTMGSSGHPSVMFTALVLQRLKAHFPTVVSSGHPSVMFAALVLLQ